MDISVVVPLYNEAESLPELHAWIQRVMKANNFSYEIILSTMAPPTVRGRSSKSFSRKIPM